MIKKNESDFLTYECDNGKYTELLPLYNTWHKATYIRSVGNTTGAEWDALVEYCIKKEHHIEVLEFFLDLVKMREQEYNEGTNGSKFIGWFIVCLDKCFPGLYTCDGYINPMEIQKMYVVFATLMLSASSSNIELTEDIINNYLSK